ncbi:MAG: hypothetical protein P8Y94_03760 [Acidobacteriota bacterium]
MNEGIQKKEEKIEVEIRSKQTSGLAIRKDRPKESLDVLCSMLINFIPQLGSTTLHVEEKLPRRPRQRLRNEWNHPLELLDGFQVPVLGDRRQTAGDDPDLLHQCGSEQLPLTRTVLVNGAFAHPQLVGELVHSHMDKPAREEHLTALLKNAIGCRTRVRHGFKPEKRNQYL